MSARDCCATTGAPDVAPACPRSRGRGEPVGWRTVAALTAGPVPARQEFWLCRDPQCDVAYFGEAGTLVLLAELRVRPGFKQGGELVCYCFHFHKRDLDLDARTGGATIPDRIAALVKAGACACEVRNPSGKCCLREVRAATRGGSSSPQSSR